MDRRDLEIIQSGDVEQSAIVFKRFVEKVKSKLQYNNIDFNNRTSFLTAFANL